MNKKNPLVVFAGLGLAGIVALLGVTKDRWMPGEPQATTATSATTGEQAAPAAGDTDASAAKTTTAVEKAPEPTPAPAENTVTAGATGETTGGETAAGQPAASGETAAAGQEQATTAVASSDEQGTQAQPSEAAATTTDTSQQQATAETGQQQATTETGQATSASEQPAEKIVPTFDTVRVEKSGEAVIAGRAEPGSEVAVKLNGATVGTTKADSEGAFVVVPQEPLAAGGGSLTIESTSPSGGEAVHSEQTVAVVVPEKKEGEAVVAVVSPEEPTQVLQAPAAEPAAEVAAEQVTEGAAEQVTDGAAGNQTVATKTEEATTGDAAPQPAETAPAVQVSLDAVDYDPDGNIVFSGRAAAGSTVRLYVDNAAVGDAVAGSDGKWSFGASSQIASGNHKLRVDQLAADGKVLGRVELPFFREDATKVAQQSGSDTTTPATGQETTTAAATTTETGQTAQTVGEGETQAAAAPQPEIKEGRIVIQPGNNLWTISQVIYGRGVKYTVIYQANQEQIRDPDLIYPGQVFRTPDVMPPESIDPTRRDPLTAEEGGTVGQ